MEGYCEACGKPHGYGKSYSRDGWVFWFCNIDCLTSWINRKAVKAERALYNFNGA